MASIVAIKLLMDFLMITVIYTRTRHVALSTMIYGIIQILHGYRRAFTRILTVLKESELSQTLHFKESPLNKDQLVYVSRMRSSLFLLIT